MSQEEVLRINELLNYHVLDSESEKEFDTIVQLAAQICGTPIALISLVDEKRQWFKAKVGLGVDETARDISFCTHAIEDKDTIFVVPNALKDDRFKNNPLVVADPNIVFYTGIPLVNHRGYALGTLCVIDREEKQLNEFQINALRLLKEQTIQLLENRKTKILSVKNEEKLSNIIDSIEGVVWEMNFDTLELIYISNQIEKVLGYSFNDWCTKKIVLKDLIVYEDRQRTFDTLLKYKNQDTVKAFQLEYRMMHANGKVVWIMNYVNIIKDEYNKESIIGLMIDNSLYKNTQVELQNTNRQINSIIENAEEAVYFLVNKKNDLGEIVDFTIDIANKHSEEDLALPRDKFIKKGIREVFDKELIDDFFKEFVESITNNKIINKEYYIPNNFPNSGWFKHQIFPLDNGLLIFNKNISKEKEIEIELNRSRKMLEDAGKISRIGSWEVNFVNQKIYWSDTTREIHEVSSDFQPDLNTAINFYKEGESRNRIQKCVDDGINFGKSWDEELEIVTGKGNIRWVRAMGEAQFDQGICVRIFGTFQDIHTLVINRKALESMTKGIGNIMKSSTDMLCTIDREGKFVRMSNASENILGYTPEEMLGTKVENYISDKFKYLTAELVNGLFSSGKSFTGLVNKVKHKSGRLVIMNWSASLDQEEQLIYAVGRDVTEEIKLKRELERLSLFAKETINGITITDKEGKITWVNSAFEKITGYSLAEMIGKNPGSILQGKETNQETIKFIRNKIKLREPFDVVLLNYSKTGKKYWVRVQVQPVFKSNGDFLYFFGMQTDVTSEIEAHQKLQKSELRFRSLIENSTDGYLLLNENFEIIDFSESAWNIIKFSNEDLKMKNIEKFIDPIHLAEFKSKLLEVSLNENTIAKIEHKIKLSGEQYIWVETIMINLLSNPAIGAFVLSLRNIDQRKKHEEDNAKLISELTDFNRDLLQFSYIVSHNLRGPVASILGLTNLIKLNKILPDERTMDMLHRESLNLDMVLRDLNEILSIKNSTNDLVYCKFESICKKAIDLLDIKFDPTEVEIKFDFSKAEGMFSVFAYVQSIFYNIISNSIKYKDVNKAITTIFIESKKVDNKIRIEFTDNGLGMDLKKVGSKIFGMYQRFNSRIEGKGMGLFIVKTTVHSIGGTIEVESKPGVGTKFILEFLEQKVN